MKNTKEPNFNNVISASAETGLVMVDNSSFNSFNNIDVYSNSYRNIQDPVYGTIGTNNILSYNNSYGQILFLDNLVFDVFEDLTFGPNQSIQIGPNYAFINTTELSSLNKPANITLYNTSVNVKPLIKKGGYRCTDCSLLSSSTEDDHSFNVTSWNNYSLAYNDRISLDTGWNMLSFGLSETGGQTEDVNISLSEGWNLVGYSGIEDISYSSINTPATVQRQFVTLDANTQQYKMTPYHNTNLEAGKAYWVYATAESNMTIPNAKPAEQEEESISLGELRFTNGTAVKTLAEAVSAGWIEGTSEDRAVRWYNSSVNFSEATPWVWVEEYGCVSDGFGGEVCSGQNITSWDGIFMKGSVNGIEILR